jgi:hypothetical protein
VKAPRGSLAIRLDRLEDRAAARPPAAPAPRDEEGWLASFEEWGREGHFDHEPDFPVALALFRAALARARASMDPPFDPLPEFRPEQRFPHIRLEMWRTKERFSEVCAGLDWLSEMLARLVQGIPPVSEAEFAELAAWFRVHDAALYALSLPSELLDVGGTVGRGVGTFVTTSPTGHGLKARAGSPRMSANSRPAPGAA